NGVAIAKCLNSPEYLSALETAVSKGIEKGMQDRLAAEITHGREGHALTDVAAYNPLAKADYVSALQQLQRVNFPLLAELKTNKDASIKVMMNIMRVEEHLAKRLGLNELQPHADQLMVPIHHSSNKTIVGVFALSLALDVSDACVWRIRENIMSHRYIFQDVFISLAEPLSGASLTGMKGTFDAVPVTADITTDLSVTLAFVGTVTPLVIDEYRVMGTDDQSAINENVVDEDANPFPNVDDANPFPNERWLWMSERANTLLSRFPNLLNTPPSFPLEFCLGDLDRPRLILENTIGLGLRERLDLLFGCNFCHNTRGGMCQLRAHLGLVKLTLFFSQPCSARRTWVGWERIIHDCSW
nr:nonaspanin [Tanacetum cinerariifolium]